MQAIRVQFKTVGKRYFFGLGGLNLKNKDKVIVNTIRGIELGEVYGEVFELDEREITSELKDIIRLATEEDIKNYDYNESLESDVISKTKELVKKNNLEMKVLDAEYTLDRAKLLIYFESENRIDFRELVKDLAEVYHTRIELRQVGSRDSAKVFGGIGPCGLILCCKTFLSQFDNVTVKMAKNQNLSLNPVKISGNCGKLLCCINYENETYNELRKNAPDVGDIIMTENGEAKVLTSDVINGTIKVKYLNDSSAFGYLKFSDAKDIISSRKQESNLKEIEDDIDF